MCSDYRVPLLPRQIGSVVLFLVLAWSLAGCALFEIARGEPASATAASSAQGNVLARVNGAELTRAELDRRLALVQVLVWLSSGNRNVELDEPTHIDKWIESELLAQAAARADTAVTDAEASAEIARLISESAQSDSEVDLQLGLSGLTRSDLVAYQRRAMTVQRFTATVIWQEASEVEKQSRLATWLVRERATARIEKPSEKPANAATGTYAGSSAPDFSLPLLGGGSRALSAARGKVVLLNFWASWCGPCRNEMPAIEDVYGQFRDSGLEVWAVNVGEDEQTVRHFIDELGLTFPVLLDKDSHVSRLYRVYALPTSYFIGKEGVIRQVALGEMSTNSLNDYVQRSLR